MTNRSTNALNRIALIGFGEVGQMLARELSASRADRITAFDIAFADQESPQSIAAQTIGVIPAAR